MTHKASRTEAIEQLRTAFDRLRVRPFPDDCDNDDASPLRAELVEFDGYVAGRITTLINGGRLSSHELESDSDLIRQRLEALAASDSPGAKDALKYRDHVIELTLSWQ